MFGVEMFGWPLPALEWRSAERSVLVVESEWASEWPWWIGKANGRRMKMREYSLEYAWVDKLERFFFAPVETSSLEAYELGRI